MKHVVTLRVLQSNGAPAPFAYVKVYRHERWCFLWWCWDMNHFSFDFTVNFYGEASFLLDEATWRFEASALGKSRSYTQTINSDQSITIKLPP